LGIGRASGSCENSQLQPDLAKTNFHALGKSIRKDLRRALHVGASSLDLRHDSFPPAARKLERVLGFEVSGQNFCLGRTFYRVHGRATARLRQTGSESALQPE